MPLNPEDHSALMREIDRVKADTYLEVADALADWNYVRGDDGYPFYILPEKDRGTLLTDYVRWETYFERGLTEGEMGQLWSEAIDDPYPTGYDPEKDAFDGKERPMVTLGWHVIGAHDGPDAGDPVSQALDSARQGVDPPRENEPERSR